MSMLLRKPQTELRYDTIGARPLGTEVDLRLKIRAVESGVTIRHLVVQGIERELGGGTETATTVSYEERDPERHSYVDEEGWPVLKRGLTLLPESTAEQCR